MKIDYNKEIDKYYESGSRLREILILHSRSVADMALEINSRRSLGLDPDEVEAAAMLHDIGVCRCSAPAIECRGTEPYIRHGVIGAEMLRADGFPEWLARVAERHTGAGLSRDDIHRQQLPLPDVDLLPETLLEKLVCYADKFYSKSGDMRRKDELKVRASLAAHGAGTLARYDELHRMFAI